jgi:hypothetical protein
VVDAASVMPKLVPFSTCEAEYCTAALAAMAAFYIKIGPCCVGQSLPYSRLAHLRCS